MFGRGRSVARHMGTCLSGRKFSTKPVNFLSAPHVYPPGTYLKLSGRLLVQFDMILYGYGVFKLKTMSCLNEKRYCFGSFISPCALHPCHACQIRVHIRQADLVALLSCFGQVEKVKMFSGQV